MLADQLISATGREDKEPTLLSAERLPGEVARDQLISATWREDKEPTLLSAKRLPGDVARDQLNSSVRLASPMTAVKPATKASTQLSAGQLVTEEAAVAASCAYQSPAIWKPDELPSKGDLIFFTSVADPDPPDPHVFGPPGSGSTSQSYGSGSFYHHAKIVRKTLIPTIL